MAQPIAPDYGQQFLFPPALEDWVPADHPARFLREFVEQLDLRALGFSVPTTVEGRPPYAPSLLLKIWLYGYFQRIRSTRKLEAACRDHLPLLWLSGLIAPDHNSLWRFWRDNQKALRLVFKQTVQLALRTGSVGLALQALDGTKIQAASSGPSGWSKKYMEELLEQLDAALEQIELKVIEENQPSDAPGYRLPAGLAQRQALRQEIKKGLAQLQADEREHYHSIEPEVRRMKVGDTNRYAYNAQAIADEKAGIIVACEASRQENDIGQLVPMVEQARENLGAAAAPTLTVADSGYGYSCDLQAAQAKGLNVLAPPLPNTNQPKTIPTRANTSRSTPLLKRSSVRKAGRWIMKDTPPRQDSASNVIAVIIGTVRCADNARAILKAGRSKCDRAIQRHKRCNGNWNSRTSAKNGRNAAGSLSHALHNSSSTMAFGAGRFGDWKQSKPSGHSYAPRSTCGCSTKNGRPAQMASLNRSLRR
jgi:transposase